MKNDCIHKQKEIKWSVHHKSTIVMHVEIISQCLTDVYEQTEAVSDHPTINNERY